MRDQGAAQKASHKEAARLARLSRHFPFATLLTASFALAAVASAISSILALGPANGLP